MDVEDVELLLVDDASQNQATAMAGELVSCSLAALTSPCNHSDHTTELLSQRAVHSEFRGDGAVNLSAPGLGIDRLIRRPLFMLGLPNSRADVR